MEFEQGKYYVVELKLSKTNVKHRAITRVSSFRQGSAMLEFLTYENKLTKWIKDIYEIQIVHEILAMNRY